MELYVVKFLEIFFYKWGRLIARQPYLVIGLCLLWTGICCIGFLNISFNSNPEYSWDTNPERTAEGSQFWGNKDWVSNTFGENRRLHSLIFSATEGNENILTPSALRLMLKVHQDLSKPLQNVSFNDICYR